MTLVPLTLLQNISTTTYKKSHFKAMKFWTRRWQFTISLIAPVVMRGDMNKVRMLPDIGQRCDVMCDGHYQNLPLPNKDKPNGLFPLLTINVPRSEPFTASGARPSVY